MGVDNNPVSGGKAPPNPVAQASDESVVVRVSDKIEEPPRVPNHLPLEDYFVRVRAVALEVSEIIAKTTEPKETRPEGEFPLKLRRAGNQIEANGALALYLMDDEVLGTPVRAINLITPIGAIVLFEPKVAISPAAFEEVAQRFGLTPHPSEPKLYLFGRDTAGLPFTQECALTGVGHFMDNDRAEGYWKLFTSP